MPLFKPDLVKSLWVWGVDGGNHKIQIWFDLELNILNRHYKINKIDTSFDGYFIYVAPSYQYYIFKLGSNSFSKFFKRFIYLFYVEREVQVFHFTVLINF